MHYDYIILGSGAAGLSLAVRMANEPYFNNKSIAIIDPNEKNKNDRTWCYWEINEGYFESIVKKKWSKINFLSKSLIKHQSTAPYKYKMISGLDFYNYTIPLLKSKPNITFIKQEVKEIKESEQHITVIADNDSYSSTMVFKSYSSAGQIDHEKNLYVDQHFKGFFIETKESTFDPESATFMDFRIDQNGDTRFLYVLPETDKKALVEVAIFSNKILNQKNYNQILTDYIDNYLEIKEYNIIEEEFGIIPMTDYPYKQHNSKRLFHIGTGGGIVKASSGFAFDRIQKHSDQLIRCILKGESLEKSYDGLYGRYFLYDKVLLHAILKNNVSGEEIFTKLFKKKTAAQIFKFLNQDTNFLEDIGIFTAPPMLPFTKSFFSVIGR